MILVVFNLTLVVIMVMVSFVRPGAGIALALALGRHTFPDRSDPIVAAAPLLLTAALLGLYSEERRIKLRTVSVCAAMLIAVVALVGYLGSAGVPDPEIGWLNVDKTFFLLVVSVPLVLLAPSLVDWPVRRDFLLGLVLVPGALLTLSVLMGSSDPNGEGRSAALGGGPITLATAAGFAILILTFHDDALMPSMFAQLEKPFRIFAGLYLGAGMFLTGSRQPVLSLMIVIGLSSFTGGSKSSVEISSREQRRRIVRVRMASVALMLVASVGLLAVITASPGSRFALLLDPTAELRRSRLEVWTTGLDQVFNASIFGHGFGSFIRVPLIDGFLAYPHNIFIELMSEVGLALGLFSSLVIVGGLVVGRTRSMRVIWLLAVYALLGVQFSGDLYNSRYLMFFLVVALTVKPGPKGTEEEPAEIELRSAEGEISLRGVGV